MGEDTEFHEECRITDRRIESIHKTVEDIRNILQAENGVCVRLSVCERSNAAIQAEIDDHKEMHKENKDTKFRRIDIYLSLGIIVVAVMEFFKK